MAKAKVAFVDDDPDELRAFIQEFGSDYQVDEIPWPGSSGLEDLTWLGNPDVIVSDMYLPKTKADEEIPDNELQRQQDEAQKIAEEFRELYPKYCPNTKKLLQETMKLLESARERLLDAQWRGMGQSPENGFAFLRAIRRDERYQTKPVIFYSRKITVENAADAMDEGARVVRKGEAARLRREIEASLGNRNRVNRNGKK
jgi:CheY-like chemotaxis protein